MEDEETIRQRAMDYRVGIDPTTTFHSSGPITTDFPHFKYKPFLGRLSDVVKYAMEYESDSEVERVNLELGIQSIDASLEKTAEKYRELVEQHNQMVDRLASVTGGRIKIQAKSLHTYAEIKSIMQKMPEGVSEEGTLLRQLDNKITEVYMRAEKSWTNYTLKCYVNPQDYQQLQRDAVDAALFHAGTFITSASSPFTYRGVEIRPAYHQKEGEFDVVLSLNS